MRGRVALAALLFGACVVASAPAHAQLVAPEGEPSADDRAAARSLYQEGLEHVEAERWADALAAFAGAYRRSGVGAALFNAATALRALGRSVEAREALDRLLAVHEDLDASVRLVARQMLGEVTARIATLELVGVPDAVPDLIAHVDARQLRIPDERPFEVAVDPGRRRVTVESPSRGRYVWDGVVAEGARLSLDVELVEPRGGVPWWVLVGGAALIVGGALAVALVLSRPDEPPHDAQALLPLVLAP